MLFSTYLVALTSLVLSVTALPYSLWHAPTAEPTLTFPTMTLASVTFTYPSGTGTGTGVGYLPTAPVRNKRDMEEGYFHFPTGTGTATGTGFSWPTGGFHFEKREFSWPTSFPTSWPTGTGLPWEKRQFDAFPTSFPTAFPTGGFPFEKREQ